MRYPNMYAATTVIHRFELSWVRASDIGELWQILAALCYKFALLPWYLDEIWMGSRCLMSEIRYRGFLVQGPSDSHPHAQICLFGVKTI